MGKALAGTAESATGEDQKIEDAGRCRTTRIVSFLMVALALIMSGVICTGFVFV